VPHFSFRRLRPYSTSASSFGSTQMPRCAIRFEQRPQDRREAPG
jgi:hypothetical protein